MAGPLQGIVVLDLSRILAGPWATQVLADYGAVVLKIEHPRGGDDTRHWGPPWLEDAQGRETAESAYYLAANRGKHSLAIDFSQPEGQDLVRRLAGQADVLVENFKVGGLARYGLAYADLAPLHPRLVYLSISAFGQDGPDAAQPGYDAMIQARGGLMSLTGVPDGEPGAGPQKVGVAVADLMCGMYAVSAILAALLERERSGQGQFIDLALLDTQVAWLANQNLNYLVSGQAPGRKGTAHPNIVPCWCPCWRTGCADAPPRSGWSSWARRRCPAARSTTWHRCSPIRRSSIVSCGSICRTRWPAAFRACATRSATRARRSSTSGRRPGSGPTRVPSWPRASDSTPRRSKVSPRVASSRDPRPVHHRADRP
jgi:hypothetical protein